MLDEAGIKKIDDYLCNSQTPFKKDFHIKFETYFKTGGIVKLYIEPNTIEQFSTLINFLYKNNIQYKVIGFTSNIYMLDELSYGVIISTKRLNRLNVNRDLEYIEAEAGYSLQDFVRVCLIEGCSGYEGLEGVPGSIGGGIFMNAGAYGYTISDNIISVKCINQQGELFELSNQDCKFSHRQSIFKNNEKIIILSCKFKITHGDKDSISKKIRVYHIARHSYQEFSYPNLGSMFSVKGDFYREFFRKDKKYSLLCYLMKLFFKNPISKLLSRKNPNNKHFNNLIECYIKPQKLPLSFSDKSMNILINDGHITPEKIKNHIEIIRSYLGEEHPIENEIVMKPLYGPSKG